MAKAIMNDEWKTLYLARALYDAVEDCNIQYVLFGLKLLHSFEKKLDLTNV